YLRALYIQVVVRRALFPAFLSRNHVKFAFVLLPRYADFCYPDQSRSTADCRTGPRREVFPDRTTTENLSSTAKHLETPRPEGFGRLMIRHTSQRRWLLSIAPGPELGK